jgi:hypothetical protein
VVRTGGAPIVIAPPAPVVYAAPFTAFASPLPPVLIVVRPASGTGESDGGAGATPPEKKTSEEAQPEE